MDPHALSSLLSSVHRLPASLLMLMLSACAAAGEKVPAPSCDRFGDPLPPGALARMGTVRFRHGGRMIFSLALSPDDRTLVTASMDQTMRLWDVATGQEIRRLPSHEATHEWSRPPYVAFSPNGKILAAGGNSSKSVIRLWDAATGKELRKLQDPKRWVGDWTFSPDSKMVAAGGGCHCLAVWDVATGRLPHQLDGGEKELNFPDPIAFAPDGRLLASGGLRETIRIWDVNTGKEERRFTVQPPLPKEKSETVSRLGPEPAVAFSPDGRILASAAVGSPVRLWDVATGKEIRSLPGCLYGDGALAFSPDGKTIACGEVSGTVRMWETASGKEVRQIRAHEGGVTGVAFLRDGKTLVTSGGGAIRLWDVRSGAEISPDRGHTAPIVSSVLAADGRALITGGGDGNIRWWDLATGKELRRIACPTGSLSGWGAITFSPNGAIAAYEIVKSGDGKDVDEVRAGIELWDLTARKKLAQIWRLNIYAKQFSPDGRTLYTKLWDAKKRTTFIVSWDTATGKELWTLKDADGFPGVLQLSTDGKLLASMSQAQTAKRVEKSIHVRDAATGKELCRLSASIVFYNHFVAFSPDNKLLAVADGFSSEPDGNSSNLPQYIHLWDIATGKEIRQFGRTSRGYSAAVFSGDGKTLATAGDDHRIRLWETATGGERFHLEGHAGPIGNLIFAENDRTLISTSSDTTALVWDLTGTQRPTQATDRDRSSPHPQELWSALANPDAAASYRAMCRLLAAPADALALLRLHLKPVEGVDEKHIARWIADLDADAFTLRQKATEELRKHGEQTEPACRKAMAAQPSPERKRRLQELLDDIAKQKDRPTPSILRQLRAVEVLERLGTPEAQRLLEMLAGGAAIARLTQDAHTAVQRLRSARSVKPQGNRP